MRDVVMFSLYALGSLCFIVGAPVFIGSSLFLSGSLLGLERAVRGLRR